MGSAVEVLEVLEVTVHAVATKLALMTKGGHSHSPASAADVRKASRSAAQLVEDARSVSPPSG